MAFYCLVEGRRTEMALYPSWISILNPKYIQVQKIEDITYPSGKPEKLKKYF